MSEEEYKTFCKKYDKFKKNNLPTPFWNEISQTYEYVYFYNYNYNSSLDNNEVKSQLEVNGSLPKVLGDIAYTDFYYPFTSKSIQMWKENGKRITKVVVGHNHAHSFDEVVMALYNSPESFNVSKEEEEFYSKQELEYIRRVQKYLLFIGLKDLETVKAPVSRYRNKKQAKYENAIVKTFSDELIKDILDGNRDYSIIDWYPEYNGDVKYRQHEFQALIVDKEDNFKMFVEFTKREMKFYKDVKKICKNDKLKDDDKVILQYFKVLEVF